MKRCVFISLLLVGMFACPAICREFEREDAEFDIGMRERQMELEHRQSQMDMEREMQRLELEERRINLDRAHDDDDDDDEDELRPLLLLLVVIHILLAVWVYMDIRQLNRGSGLWIVLTLLAGLLAALVYAIVRLGDNRQGKS